MTTLTSDEIAAFKALLEKLLVDFPNLRLAEKVDINARLHLLNPTLEAIDKITKESVKLKLKGSHGTVRGEEFDAVRVWIDQTRLDQTALKEQRPKIHAAFLVDGGYYRIDYKVR